MKINVKIVLSSLVVLVCAGLLFAYRSIPVSKIWDNYSIVYVEKSLSENQVLSFLEASGCQGVVSFSAQQIPLVSSFTPVEYDDKTNYLSRRNMYFTDKSKQYSLYYVPSKYENNALLAIKEMAKLNTVNIGMDSVQSYPWLVVSVCIFIYLLFIVFSSHKFLFAFAALFPLAFSFAIPEYGVCCSVCLIFMLIFLSQRFFGRKYAFSILLRNFYIESLIFGSLAILFVNSTKSGFVGIMVLLSVFSVFILCKEFQSYIDLKSSFNYERLITARILPVMYKRASKICLFLSVPMVIILCIFFATAKFAPKTSVSTIAMPAPLSAEKVQDGEELPTITDFYGWSFNTIAFPYRNLNKYSNEGPLKEGDSVKYTRYSQSETGIIAKEETVYSYDNSFKREMHDYINDLGYPSIESFMLSQGEEVCVGYSNDFNAKTSNDGMNLVLIIISMLIPLILYSVYLVSGKLKYENSK